MICVQLFPALFQERQMQEDLLLLSQDVDYVLHPETGFITFKTAINEQDIIAVAFRQENGVGPDDDFKYGEFLAQGDTNTTRRLVLKNG